MITLIKPYTRIRLAFIAQELNISIADVENLLVASILDGYGHGIVICIVFFLNSASYNLAFLL